MRAAKVRSAREEDLASVKMLADANKTELGFVLLPALREAVAEGRLLTTVLNKTIIGFLHFRHRKDRVTKIYQVCVDHRYRRRHHGAQLVRALDHLARARRQLSICLACPRDLGANSFYERLGFSIQGIEPGKSRALVIWHRPVPGVKEGG